MACKQAHSRTSVRAPDSSTTVLQYTAVPQTDGAPLRTVTVRDVISDLPPISNGHSQVEMEYSGGFLSNR